MKNRLPLLCLLPPLSAVLNTACSSDDKEEAPKPVVTGSISGLVSPAGAAVQVAAVGPDGRSHTATPSSAGRITVATYDATQGLLRGTFSFEGRANDLPGGPQTVRVTNGSFNVRF